MIWEPITINLSECVPYTSIYVQKKNDNNNNDNNNLLSYIQYYNGPYDCSSCTPGPVASAATGILL